MNIYTYLEDKFVLSLESVFEELGIDCVPIVANQNGVEPRKDYCAIKPLNITRIGRADHSAFANDIGPDGSPKFVEYHVTQYESTIQLLFVGNNSGNFSMEYFDQFSGNTVIREIYQRNAIAPRRLSQVRRNPQLRESKWIDSFAMDIVVGFAVKTVQDIEWADYITLNNKLIPLS